MGVMEVMEVSGQRTTLRTYFLLPPYVDCGDLRQAARLPGSHGRCLYLQGRPGSPAWDALLKADLALKYTDGDALVLSEETRLRAC